jgi:hypothetical protein
MPEQPRSCFQISKSGFGLGPKVLGYSVRVFDSNDRDLFERWLDVTWEKFRRSRINSEILDKTESQKLVEAIDFCLRPDPLQRKDEFRPGYLYTFTEEIIKP